MGEVEKYPSNAYHDVKSRPIERDKPKREELKPIAQGKVVKPSLRKRLAESFIAASGEDIKEAVIWEWAIPGIKNILEYVVHMLLFGDKPDSRIMRSRGESRVDDVRYKRYLNRDRGRDEYIPPSRMREPEVKFTTRDAAESVMMAMIDEIAKYGRVTVKDLYTMADMPTDYAMSNWGWRDLTGVSVVQIRDGYLIKLPKVEEMK